MKEFRDIRLLSRMAMTLALQIVSSYISIPIWGFPAAISLSTFSLCLIGLLFSPKQSLAIILLYLLIGALGFPVFSGGNGGVAVFVGVTGGYLLSFPIAYPLLSLLKGAKPSFPAYTIRTILITVPIVTLMGMWGFVQFAQMDWPKAAGFALTYVPGDILKAVVSAYIAARLKSVGSLFR